MIEEEDEESAPGCAMPIVWSIVAAVVTVLACGGIGVMASGSESAGVSASQIAAFPLCAALSTVAVAIPVHFLVKKSTPIRLAAPPTAGCLGGILGVGMLFVFYAVIWPSL